MSHQINISSIVHDIITENPYTPRDIADGLARHLKEAGAIRHLRQIRDELARQFHIRSERRARQNRSGDPLHNRRPSEAHIYSLVNVKRIALRVCRQQIRERGLSTPAGWNDAQPIVTDIIPSKRLWVVHASYFYEYSRRAGAWKTGASYLCGREDGQDWAVRIPKTITTVDQAVEWHEPAAVRKAKSEGRWVKRQGDVFVIALRRGTDNLSDLPENHEFRAESRYLVHPQHRPVKLPQQPVRSYVARTLDGARGAD